MAILDLARNHLKGKAASTVVETPETVTPEAAVVETPETVTPEAAVVETPETVTAKPRKLVSS